MCAISVSWGRLASTVVIDLCVEGVRLGETVCPDNIKALLLFSLKDILGNGIYGDLKLLDIFSKNQ